MDPTEESRRNLETESNFNRQDPPPRGFRTACLTLFYDILDASPILRGLIGGNTIRRTSDPESTSDGLARSDHALLWSGFKAVPAFLIVGIPVTVAAGGYFLYEGLRLFNGYGSTHEQKKLSEMGEAGAILALVDLGGHQSRLSNRSLGEDTAPVAEIAVGVD